MCPPIRPKWHWNPPVLLKGKHGAFSRGREANHSLPSSVAGNNEWSFTSTPLCDRGVHKENFSILSVLFMRVIYQRSQFLRLYSASDRGIHEYGALVE